jgi:hypothetical protein
MTPKESATADIQAQLAELRAKLASLGGLRDVLGDDAVKQGQAEIERLSWPNNLSVPVSAVMDVESCRWSGKERRIGGCCCSIEWLSSPSNSLRPIEACPRQKPPSVGQKSVKARTWRHLPTVVVVQTA